MKKIALAAVILATSIYIGSLFAAPSPALNLQAWYDSDNKMYFDNELPQGVIVQLAEVSLESKTDKYMGLTECGATADTCLVTVSPKNNPTFQEKRMTQLHEECHVYNRMEGEWSGENDGGHGTAFQACMLRLANRHAFDNLW